MFRRLVFLPLLFVVLASVGCCTCSNRMYCGGGTACSPCGGGCGERYIHEFVSDPPCCGDPCNGCGGWNGGCGNCCRPFAFMNLWGGILGRRCDCGGCGGCDSCGGGCGCGGGGCDSCGGGYSGGFADGGVVHGEHFVHNNVGPGPQVAGKPVPQQRSVMTPRPAPQSSPRTAPPSPTARKPVQGKTTGMPRNQLQRTGNVRLMSYEDDAAEQPAGASAQTISHRANFVR